MNCANHPEAAAVAYCRMCGKPFARCASGRRRVRSIVRSMSLRPQRRTPNRAAGPSPYAAPYAPTPGRRPRGSPSYWALSPEWALSTTASTPKVNSRI